MTTAFKALPSITINLQKPNLKLIPSYTLEEEDVLLCQQYSIPYQVVYSSYREVCETEELIGDYLDLLANAKSLGIYWDTSTFDPEGLKDAIEDYHAEENKYHASDEELATHYHLEMKNNLWAYYSSLGVL